MWAGTQQSANSASASAACCYEPGPLFEKYTPTSAAPIPDPRNVKGTQPRDKSLLWKMRLAMQLVNHPELNKQQVQVILSAIDLSTPEFFAAANTTRASKAKADDAFESLKRRAAGAFTNEQVVQLFANADGAEGEEDILKTYYDLSALPLTKRKAAFRKASANTKSGLWRTHLALFFVKRELTAWQGEVLWSAMSLVTPDYFRVKSGDADWEARVGQPTYWLEQQILYAFSMDEAARMFATLGDDGQLAKSTTLALLKNKNYKRLGNSGPYTQWAHSRVNRLVQDFELEQTNTCSCRMQADFCEAWSICVSSSCSPTNGGCGYFWAYPCNGACR
jgi:hypothetical protein